MRFSTILDDPQSFTDLGQGVSSAVRYSENEQMTLKILPNFIYFVCAGNHEGSFMEIRLSEAEIFSTYVMEGFSAEKNFIVMTLRGQEFQKLINSDVEKVRLKLVKKNGRPTLSAEIKNNEFSKFIPITIRKTAEAEEFLTPTIDPPLVGLVVDQIDSFRDVVETFNKTKIEFLDMQLFLDGELRITGVTQTGEEYDIRFNELTVIADIGNAQDTEVFRVKVAPLNRFMQCLPSDACRFSIRVSERYQIFISVKHSSLEYNLYMSSMVGESG
jgi:hypothetical protein